MISAGPYSAPSTGFRFAPMLAGKERSVWMRVAGGIERLSGLDAKVWNEPAAARNALRELLSVVPVTHVQVDLAALRRRTDPATDWKMLLTRGADWAELLRECVAALDDAVRGRAVWGIGLPSPARVAADLGDASERGVLKAGLQLASFLQGFREAGLGFIAVDLAGGAAPDKVVAPALRNAEMYGWRRAVVVPTLAEGASGAEIRLVCEAADDDLAAAWARGELVGGGLGERFWKGGEVPAPPGSPALLFGAIPRDAEAADIVAAGRKLASWVG